MADIDGDGTGGRAVGIEDVLDKENHHVKVYTVLLGGFSHGRHTHVNHLLHGSEAFFLFSTVGESKRKSPVPASYTKCPVGRMHTEDRDRTGMLKQVHVLVHDYGDGGDDEGDGDDDEGKWRGRIWWLIRAEQTMVE